MVFLHGYVLVSKPMSTGPSMWWLCMIVRACWRILSVNVDINCVTTRGFIAELQSHCSIKTDVLLQLQAYFLADDQRLMASGLRSIESEVECPRVDKIMLMQWTRKFLIYAYRPSISLFSVLFSKAYIVYGTPSCWRIQVTGRARGITAIKVPSMIHYWKCSLGSRQWRLTASTPQTIVASPGEYYQHYHVRTAARDVIVIWLAVLNIMFTLYRFSSSADVTDAAWHGNLSLHTAIEGTLVTALDLVVPNIL
jgi:hypothetical protein